MTTMNTFLMYKASSTASAYTKLIDIKEFPDLRQVPEALDNTTMTDAARVYEVGIQENEALTFTAPYSKTAMTLLTGLEGTDYNFAVWFGATTPGTPDGSDGKFAFSGKLFATVAGKGVNEVGDITITIIPSSSVEFSAS